MFFYRDVHADLPWKELKNDDLLRGGGYSIGMKK